MALSPAEIKAQLRALSPKPLETAKTPQPRAPAPAQPSRPRVSAQDRRLQTLDLSKAQAEQIELAVVATLYQFPKRSLPIFAERGRLDFFVNPIYRDFVGLLQAYFESHPDIDPNALLQHLMDVGQLPKMGGPGFIGTLLTTTCVPEFLTHSLDILRDKYVAREIAKHSAKLALAIPRLGEDELWTAVAEHERAIASLRTLTTDKLEGVENFAIPDMINFVAARDETVLLGGNRWLGRGYTCLWAGGSGYGKSTLEMQAALYWATGTPLFGIKPVRALKSLIIQAENDLGDSAEQFQGVLAGIRKSGDVNLNGNLETMLVLVRMVGCSGDKFLTQLRALLSVYKPDNVWIDPLFAFAGCDLVDTPAISRFIREGIIPAAIEHKVCAHVIHHIGKPARDNDAKKNWSSFDYQFLGFGSSEIQNSFRAVNILIPVAGHEGVFRLILSKRGERAGAKDIDGQFTTSIYMEHQRDGGLLWNQVDKPDEPVKQSRAADHTFQARFTLQSVLDQMSKVNGWPAGDLQKQMKSETGMSEKTFYRLWADAKSQGKIKIDSDRKWTLK
jgi:hypothetical protein